MDKYPPSLAKSVRLATERGWGRFSEDVFTLTDSLVKSTNPNKKEEEKETLASSGSSGQEDPDQCHDGPPEEPDKGI